MEYEVALSTIGEYTYALLYKFSEQKLCKVSELKEDDWDECMEARLFSKTAELHLFPQEKTAVICSDEQDGEYSDVTYDLGNKYSPMGRRVIVRRYFGTDEDGQVVIRRTRLQDIQ